MFRIVTGPVSRAQKVVGFGPEGIGKTTFASRFPDALFIDTEGGTDHMDVCRASKPQSFTELVTMVKQVAKEPGVCKTLVLDTADWAETMCIAEVCAKYKKAGIEDFGYGKGYVYVQEEFGKLLNALEEVVTAGINVVVLAHAKMRKFEQPDEMGAYDRWEMKLTKQVAPMVKEWADMVLFMNYKTYVVSTDDSGKKHKAQGGKRVMYTTHHPCWDAKNRHGLPEELPLDYESIRACIEQNAPQTAHDTPNVSEAPETVETVSMEKDGVAAVQTAVEQLQITKPDVPTNTEKAVQAEDAAAEDKAINWDSALDALYPGVPTNLAALMQGSRVLEEEVREVLASKGHYPRGTSWEVMVKDGYVEGWIIPFWDKIVEQIEADPKRLPF